MKNIFKKLVTISICGLSSLSFAQSLSYPQPNDRVEVDGYMNELAVVKKQSLSYPQPNDRVEAEGYMNELAVVKKQSLSYPQPNDRVEPTGY